MSSRSDILEIDASKLKRMQILHVAFLIFDIRFLADFQEGHIQGAVHVEPSLFLEKLPGMVPKKDTPIVLYDNDGIGSGDLVLAAEKLGYTNVVNLEGGYCEFSKLPPGFSFTR